MLKKNIYVAKIMFNNNIRGPIDCEKYSSLFSLAAPYQDYTLLIKIDENRYVPLDAISSVIDLYLAHIGLSGFVLTTKKDNNHPFYIDESSLDEYYPSDQKSDTINLKTLRQLPF